MLRFFLLFVCVSSETINVKLSWPGADVIGVAPVLQDVRNVYMRFDSYHSGAFNRYVIPCTDIVNGWVRVDSWDTTWKYNYFTRRITIADPSTWNEAGNVLYNEKCCLQSKEIYGVSDCIDPRTGTNDYYVFKYFLDVEYTTASDFQTYWKYVVPVGAIVEHNTDTLNIYSEATGVYQGECSACKAEDQGPRHCPDGTYASDYIQLDAEGFIINQVRCVPCKPGTFNTCLRGISCDFGIPSSHGDRWGGSDMFSHADYDLVGQCFPCRFAVSIGVHYGDSPNKRSIISGGSTYSYPLTWYCPGNEANDGVPRMCQPPFLYASADNSSCTCEPGTYESENSCVLCPPGFYCPAGEKLECPDDTSQRSAGATECIPCDTQCGNGMLPRRCVFPYKDQDQACVRCSTCSRAYASTSAEGKVACVE
jgi:hypothetical protein